MPHENLAPLEIACNGVNLVADPSGALIWPAERLAIVADLHLEKGSSFAPRGTLLPPYDTRATLERLAAVIERHAIRRLVALGDSFHDAEAAERLAPEDAAQLTRLIAPREWIWIAGNHDPQPPRALGGSVVEELVVGPLRLRHRAAPGPATGELSGHFHPVASVRLRAGRFTGRCFVADGSRIVLPAFGSFTGGLDIFDRAIIALFPRGFAVHLLGRGRVTTIPPARLAPAPRLEPSLPRAVRPRR